jgi:hypothetical protein
VDIKRGLHSKCLYLNERRSWIKECKGKANDPGESRPALLKLERRNGGWLDGRTRQRWGEEKKKE